MGSAAGGAFLPAGGAAADIAKNMGMHDSYGDTTVFTFSIPPVMLYA